MKYTFDKDIPYEFKDVTGLAKEDSIGQSILEEGKVIGGLISYKHNIPVMGLLAKCVTICAIEIVPEHRNKGIGTAIVTSILTECDCVHAAVQDEKAWDWWKKMGAQPYMAVLYPEDAGKENPRAHTLAFVLAKSELETMAYRSLFQSVSSNNKGVLQSKTPPKIDFSINKKLK